METLFLSGKMAIGSPTGGGQDSPTGERTGSELTERELEVLRFVARGLANKAVAREIGRTDETVKEHLKNVFSKLGVTDRTEAVTVALARGLIHQE